MIAGGKRYIVHGSRATTIRLWCMGDLHLGNRSVDMDRITTAISEIEYDPFSFWVGMGDYADYIGIADPRFDPDTIGTEIRVKDLGNLGRILTEKVRDLFNPIREKCCGLLFGNHEARYMLERDQMGLHSWLCTELNVPDLGYSCFFDLICLRGSRIKTPYLSLANNYEKEGYPRRAIRIFCHHGAGFAQTPGGKLNRLIQFMDSFEADLYLVAHVHDETVKRLTTLSADAACDTIMAQDKLGAIAGSFLKSYQRGVTSYAERRGYRPVSLGPTIIEIHPETGELSVKI